MVTTLFQHYNAVWRIVLCNITFRQPILLMVKPVLFGTVKETNTDHPISDSQIESQFRRSIALRSNLSKSVFFFFKENALLGLVCDDVVTDRCSLLPTSVEPLSSAMCENGILSKNG